MSHFIYRIKRVFKPYTRTHWHDAHEREREVTHPKCSLLRTCHSQSKSSTHAPVQTQWCFCFFLPHAGIPGLQRNAVPSSFWINNVTLDILNTWNVTVLMNATLVSMRKYICVHLTLNDWIIIHSIVVNYSTIICSNNKPDLTRLNSGYCGNSGFRRPSQS